MQYTTRKCNSSDIRNLARTKLAFSMASYERHSALLMNLFLRCQVLEKSTCSRHLLHSSHVNFLIALKKAQSLNIDDASRTMPSKKSIYMFLKFTLRFFNYSDDSEIAMNMLFKQRVEETEQRQKTGHFAIQQSIAFK